jgi:hypothetical protein
MASWLWLFMILTVTLELLEIITLSYERRRGLGHHPPAAHDAPRLQLHLDAADHRLAHPVHPAAGRRAAGQPDEGPRSEHSPARLPSSSLIQVFSMRWNVVIGGQLFSKSLRGLRSMYEPRFFEKEDLAGAADRLAAVHHPPRLREVPADVPVGRGAYAAGRSARRTPSRRSRRTGRLQREASWGAREASSGSATWKAQLGALRLRLEANRRRRRGAAAGRCGRGGGRRNTPAVAARRRRSPGGRGGGIARWAGTSALLPRVSTVSFLLVAALALRTLADSGIVGPQVGSYAGGYAASLMLAGWVLFSRRSVLAPSSPSAARCFCAPSSSRPTPASPR